MGVMINPEQIPPQLLSLFLVHMTLPNKVHTAEEGPEHIQDCILTVFAV